jgi:3',5'-nucleoside bisphosphate phosphatase
MSTDAPGADGVDLHLHTRHSDGLLEPAGVIARAADAQVRMLALTDHDSLAGLPEAQEHCVARGITWISGIELSASWHGQSIHVLGFDFDPEAPQLLAHVQAVQELRRQRLREIARRLERKGIPAAALVARIEAHHSLLTRTHLARELVASNVARSMGEVFKRLLGRGTPGHVPSSYPSLASVITCLRDARGVAVLAHPLRYTLSGGARRRLLGEFRDAGGIGIEVVCGNARGQIEALAQMAQRFGLAGSVGSDFHDPQVPWNPPGRLAKLPLTVIPVWRHFRLPT